MARTTKADLAQQVTELEAKVAALEAKLELARECWRNQKARISELEAQLASPGRGALTRPAQQVSPARAAYLARQAAKPAYVPLAERSAGHAAAKAAAIESGRAVLVQ